MIRPLFSTVVQPSPLQPFVVAVDMQRRVVVRLHSCSINPGGVEGVRMKSFL